MTTDVQDTIRPFHDNLRSARATKPLTRWLISAAEERKTITYGEAGRRLEEKCGFGPGCARNMGVVADAAMDEILFVDESAPLLISLLVREDTKRPGPGFSRKWLDRKYIFDEGGKSWIRAVEQAMEDAYAYGGWGDIYERLYEPQSLDPLIPNDETVKAIEAAERGDLVTVGDVNGLMAYLNADD